MSLSNETNKKPCFLINWSLTGKRGREPSSTNRETSSTTTNIPSSSSSSSEEEDQQTAAHFLLMLSASSTTASTTNTTTTNTTKDQDHHHQQYRCGICDKSFGSHQALGGHRASHFKIMKTRVALIQDQPKPFYIEAKTKEEKLMDQGLEDDVDDDDAGVKNRKKKSKKTKFECSICGKSFSSGQALGGHKRFHWSRNHIKPPPPPSDDHSSGEGVISSAHPDNYNKKDDDDDNEVIALPKTAKKNNRKKKIRLISSLGFDLNLPPPSSSDKNEDGCERFSTTQGSSPASPLLPHCSC